MTKILNGFFGILKVILLLISFALTFYVIMFMYQRLEKSYFEALEIFVPYVILLIIFMVNYIFGQKQVNSNIFYNFTACLVFVTLIFVAYRALADDYMIMSAKMGYNIGFNYFGDIVAPMRSMIYLLIGSNILLMFTKEKNKEVVEEEVSNKKEKAVSKKEKK